MKTSQTNEQALEASIEKSLTGHSQEELKENGVSWIGASEREELYRTGKGYYMGLPQDFDARYALDTERFWHFLEATQKEELEKLQRQNDWQLKILERFDRMVKKYGILRLLREGLKIDDAHFTLMYPLPLASSSKAVKENFRNNEFSVTRQVQYSLDNPAQEIDMAFFVNGIPFATMELKNPWTGQNAKVHAQRQYKNRDYGQQLLQFGRCIVHLAVDTDEAYMTTRLKGDDTQFLPFNRGYNNGKGNPPAAEGHKTNYLWNEVLAPKSIANIIQHFVKFDGKNTDPLRKKTLFFPRYHQLDVVRKIVSHAEKNGVGHRYLIQHSAGSGKSYSITWAAYRLIETYPENDSIPGSKGITNPLFDSVIVVTDRRVLDKQLRDSIKEFSEVKNIIAHAKNAKDLRANLEKGKKIIITTIQKFPYIVDGIADLSDKRFAVIIDEAHSSQSGTSHDNMNRAIGQSTQDVDGEFDVQDKILEVMRTRKMRGNASYLAFTATPKNNTLEKFGIKQPNDSYKPFHLYSMKQAIEEGFILDVLANYTTYKSYYEIKKSIEENPLFDTIKAQKRLKGYVELHPRTIAVKAEIMLDHFINNVVNTKKLKGKAKAIIATQDIKSAIRYYQAIRRLLADKGDPFRILVAFSGTKTLDGIEYTEKNINDMPSHLDIENSFDPDYINDKLARYFNMDEYRILVVANKYLTGFDQPKLTAMYVDKKLQGVRAVQALSRLNRAAPKYGKKTEDLFILDFYNTVSNIKDAFDDFYTATTLSEPTDVNVLHELKAELDYVGVYEWSEVEDFITKYFQGLEADRYLSPILQKAQGRFNHELDLEEEEKADFKIKAKQFVKIYGQMASIMPFEIVEWEELFWFLKFLIPGLKIKDPNMDTIDELLDSVDLSTYGLERTKLSTSIGLDDSETEVDPQNANPRGAHGENDEDLLDSIIDDFNERWFQGWEATPEDQRIKLVSLAKSIEAHPDYKEKYAGNSDSQNRDIAFKKIIEEVMASNRKNDLDLYKLYSQDEAFKKSMQDALKRILDAA
jgi:type I restriction enzyme R subunit